jgi:UDP-glucose 4-epimerase
MTHAILLTGASGYAGSALAAALRNSGMTVVTAGRKKTDHVFLDLLKPDGIAGMNIPAGLDVCVHAAAAHEIPCRSDPVSAYTANVGATRALIASASAAGIRRFVYISTFHVFGAPAGALAEDAAPFPANDYGLTHLMAEQMFAMWARQHGCETYVLRPANLYGEPADWATFNRWTLAPFDFARQAAGEGVIRLHSDGSPVRNYVSLDRLCSAVIAAVQGALPRLTHVAGRAWPMRELAMLCSRAAQEATGRAIPIVYGPAHAEEQPYRFFSHHWPMEEDACGDAMKQFFSSILRHQLEN